MRTSEENEILEAYEQGRMKLRKPSKAFMLKLADASDRTFKKDKRINIRISNHDLIGIQTKALQNGLPYQALIAGLIHQYVEGDLMEKA